MPLPLFSVSDFASSLRSFAVALLVMLCGVPVAAALVITATAHYLTTDDAPAVVDLDTLSETSDREVIASVAVSSTLATMVQHSSAPDSWQCQASSVGVFRVNEGDTSIASGIGPYCSTCALGPLVQVPAQRVFLLAAAPTTIMCSRLNGSKHAAAAGLMPGAADGAYLRLDASNDPLTSSLSVDQATNTLASPTYTTAAGRDVVVAPAGGITGRGLFVSSSTASSTGDGVTLTGSAAALSGRTSIAFVSGVIASATDRYVARFQNATADVLRVAGNGALLPGATTDAEDLGATGNAWARLFVGTSVRGEANSKALSVQDADGVQVSSGAGQLEVQPDGDIVAEQVITAAAAVPVMRLPAFANTAVAAGAPTTSCSSASVGSLVVLDSNASTSTIVCICARRAGVYAYRAMDDFATACP